MFGYFWYILNPLIPGALNSQWQDDFNKGDVRIVQLFG